MRLHPERGVTAERLAAVVRELSFDVFNARGQGGTIGQRLLAYQQWASKASARLEPMLPPAAVDDLVLTPRYWALYARDPHMPPAVLAPVEQELDSRYRAFEQLAADLERDRQRYTPSERQFVADTNVYLHHPKTFDHIDWHQLAGAPHTETATLFVPLLVVDELDDGKRNPKVSSRARTTLRELTRLLLPVGDRQLLHPPPAPPVRVQLVPDPPRHARQPRADDELVDVAGALADYTGRPVTFVSGDTGAGLRASAAGLPWSNPQDASDNG